MALPIITQPTHKLTLPISKISVTFRPFLVKEEKILLLAAIGKDATEITNAIKQIVSNCLIGESVDVNSLLAVDMDYLFLNIRAKSIGNKIDQEFTCNNKIGETTCGNAMIVPLSVMDVEVSEGPKDKKIILNESTGVLMKYPLFKTYDENDVNVGYDMLISCLDSAFDETQTYSFKDQTKEEIIEWIESLTKSQFQLLQDWYDSLPTMELKKAFKCSKCGFDHEVNISDPISFF